MTKHGSSKRKDESVARSATTGCFVSSASAAYRYYASNESARNQAVERFENRVAVAQKATKTVTAKKKSRRSA